MRSAFAGYTGKLIGIGRVLEVSLEILVLSLISMYPADRGFSRKFEIMLPALARATAHRMPTMLFLMRKAWAISVQQKPEALSGESSQELLCG
jgi:hypothetical protein